MQIAGNRDPAVIISRRGLLAYVGQAREEVAEIVAGLIFVAAASGAGVILVSGSSWVWIFMVAAGGLVWALITA